MGGTRRAAAASVAAGMHPWTIDGYGWMEKHASSCRGADSLACLCDDNATDGWKKHAPSSFITYDSTICILENKFYFQMVPHLLINSKQFIKKIKILPKLKLGCYSSRGELHLSEN